MKTISIDVQKDGLVISKFNNQEFLVKNESSGVFPDSFYVSDLGKPIEVDTTEAMTFSDEYKDFKRVHPKSSRKHLRNLVRTKWNMKTNHRNS